MIDIKELNELYSEADEALKSHFAEQRSNCRLVAGFHYKNDPLFGRFRDRVYKSPISTDVKIRLTKNHIQVCDKRFVNSIITYLPGVGIFPRNEDELQDQKAAEHSRSVWEHIAEDNAFDELKQGIVEDYFRLGEVFILNLFDQMAGKFLGYEADIDQETGEILGKERPLYQGRIGKKRVPGYNALTCPNAKTWEENPYTIFRFHFPTKEMKARYAGDEKKASYITDCEDETYQIFDSFSGEFRTSKGMTMIKQAFFRPCAKYPEGWFAYFTTKGILEEGPLAKGYPIHFVANERSASSFRGKSPIRHVKHAQVEVNRTASMIVKHQITLGDDKVFIQAGSGKLSPSNQEPGMRAYNYMGSGLQVVQGRTGDQYLGWMDHNIQEIYKGLMVEENDTEKSYKDDAFGILFKSLKDKKRFTLHSNKIERLLCRVASHALDLARTYLPDDMLVPMVGKNEYVNIAEFKRAEPIQYMVKVIPHAEDFESVMGKSLQFSQILQYAGSSLPPEHVALFAKNMPFLNGEKWISKLTQDLDNAENDELALDRGERVPVYEYDNHEYLVQALIARTKRKDFQLLHPQIQALYNEKINEHNQWIAKKRQDLAMANAGAIPTGGPLVKCYIYLPDPLKPNKQELVKIPIESLNWLIKKLEAQGFQQNAFMQMPDEVKASVGRILAAESQPKALVPQAQNEFDLAM